MKQKRRKTLMFQLIVYFSMIFIVVIALLAVSWGNSQQENQTSATISKLTTPYVRLYAGLDELNNSIAAIPHSYLERQEHMENAVAVRQASSDLMQILNEDGYNRTSIDLHNTVLAYLTTYDAIWDSYANHDYAQVNLGIDQLHKSEQWIRDYLKQIDGDVNERQSALLLRSEQIRARYYRTMLVLGSLIFFLCIFALLLTARRFVSPIQTLCRNVKEFRLSDSMEELHARGIPCRPDSLQEIRTLATAIYSMQDTVLGQYAVEKNIEMLRTRLSEEALHTATVEKELHEAQLKALQAQINPHFLFNTLNMIAQMAYIEGAERTTDLLETFSDYFRYNVESFERSVTLAEELANLRGYIALQRERFGDRIAYFVEADDAVREIQVPCLILQPLVENAISHGLRMKTENGEVRTTIRAIGDGGFAITVSDNGCGMDEDALRRMIQRATQTEADADADHRSIGISNVVRRLKLAFGDGVTFHAQSAPGEGMRITLRVEGGNAL